VFEKRNPQIRTTPIDGLGTGRPPRKPAVSARPVEASKRYLIIWQDLIWYRFRRRPFLYLC